jgi:hypothetical protein
MADRNDFLNNLSRYNQNTYFNLITNNKNIDSEAGTETRTGTEAAAASMSIYNLASLAYTFYNENQTNDSSTSTPPQQSPLYEYNIWQKIIFGMFIVPIIFFSIAGNILVVIAIVKYPFLKITNNIFLASLAVADCAVGMTAMTMNALQILSGHWYLKAFMCRFWFSCDVLFSTASILHLFCVSFDRYLSISKKFAFNYKTEDPTKSWRVRIMIATVWITSCLLSFGPIFTDLFTTKEHAAAIDRLDYENGQCAFIVNLPYRFISSAVSFWLPGAGMIVFYTLVMKKAYYLEMYEFKKYQSISHSHHADLNHSSSFYKSQNFNQQPRTNRDARMSRDNKEIRITKWKREYKVNLKVFLLIN